VTQLRKAMLEELQRRNLSPITARIYLRAVEEFARYYKKSPDQLGPEHIRQYQAHLFTERKLGAIAVTQQLSALRFLFLCTLKRPWMLEDMACPKRPSRLPEILSREEVERLIECAASPLHRIWLLTLYATGMRREELVHLKIGDIDSARMLIHIGQGIEQTDRYESVWSEVWLPPSDVSSRDDTLLRCVRWERFSGFLVVRGWCPRNGSIIGRRGCHALLMDAQILRLLRRVRLTKNLIFRESGTPRCRRARCPRHTSVSRRS
jgi:integrase